MKLLVDMNLSPAWVPYLAARDVAAVHWSTVGAHTAPDTEVLGYARDNGLVVFTHDLDFGVLLALTRGAGPSVLQVRTQDVMPEDIGTPRTCGGSPHPSSKFEFSPSSRAAV